MASFRFSRSRGRAQVSKEDETPGCGGQKESFSVRRISLGHLSTLPLGIVNAANHPASYSRVEPLGVFVDSKLKTTAARLDGVVGRTLSPETCSVTPSLIDRSICWDC